MLGSAERSSKIHVLTPNIAGSLESHHLLGPARYFLKQMLQVFGHPYSLLGVVAMVQCRQKCTFQVNTSNLKSLRDSAQVECIHEYGKRG